MFMNSLTLSPKVQKILIFAVLALLAIAFLDKKLAIGLVLIAFLTGITFLIFNKLNLNTKTIYVLFLIALFIHLAAVLFIYYADFQPFSGSGGDYLLYHRQATEIAQRVQQSDFSLKGLGIGHYYPVIVGYIYALTFPDMLIGQLFGVWLAAISAFFAYLIIIEMGAKKKWAFLTALIISIYPSYLFFGSLLLKDTVVIPLVLAGLWLILKLIKNFSWKKFVIFYILLGAIIHFRFYVGYSVLLTFIFCWLLLSNLKIKKRIIYGLLIIFLLGFLPQFWGYGYYGHKTIEVYLNQEKITFYREVAYSSSSASVSIGKTSNAETEADNFFAFPLNCLKSFVYVLIGPLPWHFQSYRQLFVLVEMIPWYFLLFFIGRGIFAVFKSRRIALLLVVFSVLLMGVLALFITNFGIITRIRIPAFISLICFAPFGINWNSESKIIKFTSKLLSKFV